MSESLGVETRRDKAWMIILQKLDSDGYFAVRNVDHWKYEIHAKTLRNTAKSMELMGWLERDSSRHEKFYISDNIPEVLTKS